MNKYLVSLIIAVTVISVPEIAAAPVTKNKSSSFKQLVPYIIKDAQQWVDSSIKPLAVPFQLAYLNLFALNTPQSSEAFKQCFQFIETNPELTPVQDALSNNIVGIMQKYMQSVHDKISASKKTLSQAEEAKIMETLRTKIQELVVLMNTIYYETLYKHIAENNQHALSYMFDNSGIIAEGKRTTALPRSI